MKNSFIRYEAWSDVGYKLTETADTLDEMKEKVDASNQRAENLGYEAERYMMVKVETITEKDGDRFIKRVTEETFVEMYPISDN